MSRWTKVSIIVSILLIGIPTAANFYPPIFSSLADRLPLNLILTWMGRVGILLLGFIGGWWMRGGLHDAKDSVEDHKTGVTEIEGCIETGVSCWIGKAEIVEGKVSYTGVERRAICPNCQTVMYDGENSRGSMSGELGLWECPNCGNTAYEDSSAYEDVQKVFEKHVRQMAESEGEEYSLETLISQIEGEVTPRRIWKQYVDVIDDEKVSLNCFH